MEDELPPDENEGNRNSTIKKIKNMKNILEKRRKEKLKSIQTGVGLRISIDSSITGSKATSSNKLRSANDEYVNDNAREQSKSTDMKDNEAKDDGDDDDDIEEVPGQTAREDVIEQLKTEEKLCLQSRKQRKRKARNRNSSENQCNTAIKLTKTSRQKNDEKNGNDDDGENEELDEEFFAQLDVVRGEEVKERKETEMLKARTSVKGKHTNFVFSTNQSEGVNSEPVKIDENIQVVVLKNLSTTSNSIIKGVGSSFGIASTLSKTALIYSRNQLIDGSDSNIANYNKSSGGQNNNTDVNRKRKSHRSDEETKPWKRAKQQMSLGRSRMKKGRPAIFFRKKR